MQNGQAVSTPSTLADVLINIHVYAGVVLLGIGVGFQFGWPFALITLGTLFLALGVFSLLWSRPK